MAGLTVCDRAFRSPSDLSVSHRRPQRIAILGSCLMQGWPDVIRSLDNGCEVDFYLVNNQFELPESTGHLDEVAFQVVQIPMRSILRDYLYFRLSYDDVAGYRNLFEDCKTQMLGFLERAMRWNVERGLLTFVNNFLLPQQNPMGRLLPRYDLRNPAYFIEKLNEALAEAVASYRNAHVFDFDQVVATFGRRYVQDDFVWQLNHASALSDADFELDADRLDGVHRASEYYPSRSREMIECAWEELLGMYRTAIGADAIKIVIVDLDDTVWRGVAAERDEIDYTMVEGWPLAFVEALCFLKRRGVLLAIVSKNDESTIEKLWPRLMEGRMALEDFAVRKINWLPKPENVAAVLSEVNLLAKSALYIDDNPVERASVAASFPGIRVLGEHPLLWRRLLLWAPELQTASISQESVDRTAMVRSGIEREKARVVIPREQFLRELELRVRFEEITASEHASFARAFELLNKTNQFNTTGKRWTFAEMQSAMETGTSMLAVRAADRFSDYGLIALALVRSGRIVQAVMSCRVVGMEIETALLSEIVRMVRERGCRAVSADLRETDANALCRDLYAKHGFEMHTPDGWRYERDANIDMPQHVIVNETTRV